MTARESFQAWRNGWADGVKNATEDARFMRHATRPDLTKEYLRGYDEGQRARIRASSKAMRRLKFVPEILR